LLAQDQKLTRRVGFVTLLLVAASCFFMIFIYDQIEWGAKIRVRVHFLSAGGLKEGADFVVAGRAIGHVETIALSPRGASTLLGGQEGVVVTIALDADAARRVSRAGDIFVTSRGALSSRYLEIGPRSPASAGLAPSGPPPEPGPVLQDKDELRGRDPPSLDRVLQRTWDNMTTAARFVEEVRPEANALGAELDKLRATMLDIAPEILFSDDFGALIDEGRRTYAALGGDDGLDRIAALRDKTGRTIDNARAMIATLRTNADALQASLRTVKGRLDSKGAQAFERIDQAIDRVRAAIDKVDPLLAQVAELQQKIERGDGSLLKLMRDPEFPEDAKELGKILKRQPWRILDRPPK
jgi:ABC-type transporter Mla subunit MlaD